MFLPRRFYLVIAAIVLLAVAGYWLPVIFTVAQGALVLMGVALLVDFVLLWHKRGITAQRKCVSRFSNGDDNSVTLHLASRYPFATGVQVIDEVPAQFQWRHSSFSRKIAAHGDCHITYTLRPTERGNYGFGLIRVFARSPLGLIERRFSCGEPVEVKVYPSYLMLRKYQIFAISNRLTSLGIKHQRRPGNNNDLEQIKDYALGDEYRHINWTATARRGSFMVNVYNDERSQNIYCLIDKGRTMQQVFDGMTLLDYAINASLVLSYVALCRHDKAGIMSFTDVVDDYVPAKAGVEHIQPILDKFYNLQSQYAEPDFSQLWYDVRRMLNRRSLIVLFTNFLSMNGLKRQLPYLQQLNRNHRLLVVFFIDTDIRQLSQTRPGNDRDFYVRAIAEQLENERQLIARTLSHHGITTLLTTPSGLTIDVLNRYIGMRGSIG